MTDKIKTLPERLNEIAEMLVAIADELANKQSPSTAEDTSDSGSNPPGDKPPTPPGTGL